MNRIETPVETPCGSGVHAAKTAADIAAWTPLLQALQNPSAQ
jgi:hypothetical protein